MKIIKVKKYKEKVKIILDDSRNIEVLPTISDEFNLYINKIIDENELFKIETENKIEGFYLLAIKQILQRQISPNKVKDYLRKKNAKKEEITKVLEKLRKFGFINEEKLVEELLDFCDAKHYGFNRIIQVLKNKHISEKMINSIEYNSKREKKHAEIQIEKLTKKFRNKNFNSLKKSVFASLIRLGFNEDISLELVNKISNSNHKNEINMLKLEYEKTFSKYSKKYKGIELRSKITNHLLSKGYQINDIKYVKEKYDEIS